MVVTVYRAAVDVGVENVIGFGAMVVASVSCALLENGLEDSSVIYCFLSSNVILSPLIVSMFYIPALRGTGRQ